MTPQQSIAADWAALLADGELTRTVGVRRPDGSAEEAAAVVADLTDGEDYEDADGRRAVHRRRVVVPGSVAMPDGTLIEMDGALWDVVGVPMPEALTETLAAVCQFRKQVRGGGTNR